MYSSIILKKNILGVAQYIYSSGFVNINLSCFLLHVVFQQRILCKCRAGFWVIVMHFSPEFVARIILVHSSK